MCSRPTRTILFLFGRRPAERAILQAQVVASQLRLNGWDVQTAALSKPAATYLAERFGQPVQRCSVGLAGLGLLLRPRLAGSPQLVHAWDLEAAAVARRIAGRDARLCVTADHTTGQAASRHSAAGILRSADVIICHHSGCSTSMARAGVPAGRIRLLPPAVDKHLLASDSLPGLSGEAGRRVKIDPATQPVLVTPPLMDRTSGHFEAAWATFLLRRGGIRAQLLLPHPGRESTRIERFATACNDRDGVVVCPAGTSWLDLLRVADIVILPDRSRTDPIVAGWALASGRPVVVRRRRPSRSPAARGIRWIATARSEQATDRRGRRSAAFGANMLADGRRPTSFAGADGPSRLGGSPGRARPRGLSRAHGRARLRCG